MSALFFVYERPNLNPSTPASDVYFPIFDKEIVDAKFLESCFEWGVIARKGEPDNIHLVAHENLDFETNSKIKKGS